MKNNLFLWIAGIAGLGVIAKMAMKPKVESDSSGEKAAYYKSMMQTSLAQGDTAGYENYRKLYELEGLRLD